MDNSLQPNDGHFSGLRHLFPLRVFYEDTDLSGLVYHANYLKFCERARSSMLRILEIDQRAAVEDGTGNYAVAEANLRYFAPARLDDALVIETHCTQLRAASVRLVQCVKRGDDVLVDVAIRVGFIGPDGRPRRQPDGWRAAFEQFFPKETE